MVKKVTEEYVIFSMIKVSIVYAYDKVVDAVIPSSDVVLYFPPSIEILVVTDPIQALVSSISTTLDTYFFLTN